MEVGPQVRRGDVDDEGVEDAHELAREDHREDPPGPRPGPGAGHGRRTGRSGPTGITGRDVSGVGST
ncbi:hypothetical protein GCM10009801_52910 [Streptomyces albiaxialis]|uniref:Uncharacterized protein n=1 Tax=Streptomyces albiaxialis TaxID=329523 RepID=A0ABN2WBY0_9ACTN